jgi:glyoxylate reductase
MTEAVAQVLSPLRPRDHSMFILPTGVDADGACLIEARGDLQSLRLLQILRPLTWQTVRFSSRSESRGLRSRGSRPPATSTCNDRETDLTPDELIERVRGKQGLIALLTNAVNKDVIAAGSDLKVIANIAVGYNNIDVSAARARGIIVTNTPDVLTESSADLTWTLILGITRRVVEGDRLVRANQWKGWALDFMLGTELGRQAARESSAWGASAAPSRPRRRRSACGSPIRRGHRRTSRMPSRCRSESPVVDIRRRLVALSADQTETRHLINQPAFARMKRSAYLINTSRGPVVDEAALAWALKNHLIRRGRAGRVRGRAKGSPRPAHARERRARASPRERNDRDADSDGGSGCSKCDRGADWSSAADSGGLNSYSHTLTREPFDSRLQHRSQARRTRCACLLAIVACAIAIWPATAGQC